MVSGYSFYNVSPFTFKKLLDDPEDHLSLLNKNAQLICFGQEINPQTYAICKSDILIKGANADYIKEANTLSDDIFAEDKFDYVMSNYNDPRELDTELKK